VERGKDHDRKLRQNYGDVKAVRGVSFVIHDGEFVSLLGPSGCGKSSNHALDMWPGGDFWRDNLL